MLYKRICINLVRSNAIKARDRGYQYENATVKNFTGENWRAKRLGGASEQLPDIVAVNNDLDVLLSIECKSTTTDYSSIPQDEIIRCLEVLQMFEKYATRTVIFAFQFNRTPLKGPLVEKEPKRKTRPKITFYFKILKIQNLKNIKSVSCNYWGKLNIKYFNKEDKNYTR